MEVSDNFFDLKEIPKSEFIEKFKAHEFNRIKYNEKIDEYASNIIIPGLEVDSLTHYYKGFLSEKGYNNLILPYHDHNGTRLVPPDGAHIKSILNEFKSKSQLANSDCINKILKIKSEKFKTTLDKWDVDFLFLSNNHLLSHPGGNHYDNYDQNKIFIGNGFHRLMAYGLTLEEIGTFKPIEIYYGYS